MVTRWEGETLLVKLTGILRYCCDSLNPTRATYGPQPLPPGYHKGQVIDEPQVITDPEPWGQLLLNHRLDSPRYTILPTISVVPPWDNDNETSNLIEDQVFDESYNQLQYITPTPVLPQHNAIPTVSRVGGGIVNATQRFYDALRVVMHGGIQPSVPKLRNGSHAGVKADVAGLAPHVLDTFDPLVTSTLEQESIESLAMSPVLQVCAALGILVIVMVILFHTHHFRRDCMTERRALRRVARRYHVARAQDDVEKNEEVTDVTL